MALGKSQGPSENRHITTKDEKAYLFSLRVLLKHKGQLRCRTSGSRPKLLSPLLRGVLPVGNWLSPACPFSRHRTTSGDRCYHFKDEDRGSERIKVTWAGLLNTSSAEWGFKWRASHSSLHSISSKPESPELKHACTSSEDTCHSRFVGTCRKCSPLWADITKFRAKGQYYFQANSLKNSGIRTYLKD